MWLLVGLGNPGDEYACHRHNIGFMTIDKIAEDAGIAPSAFKSKYQGLFAEARIDGQKVGLLKPQTYMNNSGQSVVAAAKFYKIAPDHIICFHDELDLNPGQLRVKKGGGNAGHNGLRSMQSHLGTPDFWRVRMGIGHPGDKARVHGYVLSNFAKAEQDDMDHFMNAAAYHVGLLLDGKQDDYMTKVAERP